MFAQYHAASTLADVEKHGAAVTVPELLVEIVHEPTFAPQIGSTLEGQ